MPRNNNKSKKSKSKSKKNKTSQSAPLSPRKLNAFLDGGAAAAAASTSADDFETDDSMSLCSELVLDVGDVSAFELENEEQDILDIIDDMDGQGESSRVVSLNKIFNKLSHRLHEDFLSSQLERFREIISASISPSRSFKIIDIGCKLACVVTISLPEDVCESFVNGFMVDLLMDLIRHASSIGSEKVAIDALAFVCYFGGNVDSMTRTMSLLNSIWESVPGHDDDHHHDKLVDAALIGWTFLMSKLDVELRVEFLHDKIPNLMTLMKETSHYLPTRITAAECISLFCDAWTSVDADVRTEFPIDLSEIRMEFERISNETSRRRRTDMRIQRSKFKQFFKAIPSISVTNEGVADEDDDTTLPSSSSSAAATAAAAAAAEASLHDRMHKWRPRIKLRFRSRVVEFEGWDRYIEYHRIKEMLGSGMQTHLFVNPRCQAVFDLELDGDELLSSLFGDLGVRERERKKRVFEDNARKAQDDVKRGRRDKYERLNHFDDNSIW